jgi:predicted ATPase
MRLKRLELIGEYKSIKGTFDLPFVYEFKQSVEGYSPLCLVGLNGSGKSNFIELIADIFGYADRYYSEQYACKKDLTYDFEIEYVIKCMGREPTVKMVSQNSRLEIYIINGSDIIMSVTHDFHDFLPSNIIAYSSGHNQGLSSVFAKTELQYFDVIRKRGVFYREYKPLYDKVMEERDAENDEVWEGLSKYVKKTYKKNTGLFGVPRAYQNDLDSYFKFPEEPLESIESHLPLGLYTDHSLNHVFFVYLMACHGVSENKSQQFRKFASEYVNISEICAFDINLRLAEYKDFETVGNIVRRLTELSYESQGLPLPDINNEINYSAKLHFKCGQKFLDAIERLYLDETVFLEHLLTLHYLTAKRWSYEEKATLRRSRYERNVPSVSGGLVPMRIMNVEVMLQPPNVTTLYDRLSDGEHQLLQIFGSLILFDHQQTLFILDEPESHFNPEWRMEFIELINKYVNLENLDLIISTHSPFILSACKSERVLNFRKDDGGNVAIEPVGVQTYGASFDSLLTSVFDLDVLISKKPLAEIERILELQKIEQITEVDALKRLEVYGDSFELNYRRNKLRRQVADQEQGAE